MTERIFGIMHALIYVAESLQKVSDMCGSFAQITTLINRSLHGFIYITFDF